MNPAQRLSELTESVIREMTRLAIKHDAINLSQGFPDFDPPAELLAAGVEALQSGYNQYTISWGSPRLRAALADKYARWYGMALDPETEITITCGVTEAIIGSLLSVVDPGDRVIILEPAHENYVAGVLFAGGKPVWVTLAPPDFELNETQLRAAFAQKPRAIILNTPHNPTGRVFSQDELRLIADLCIEHDTIAITDEIYEHIIYDGRKHIPLATLPGMEERTMTTGGFGKTYAATGWRVAWVIAPPALSNAVRTVHDFLTICAPTPLQEAAAVALKLPDSYYAEQIQAYTARRERMMDILEEAGFRATPPEGAYYVMADFSAIQPEMDDVAFAHWLTVERRVAVVPGSSFYNDPRPGRHLVRFAFPKRLETLAQAAERLARPLERD
ncbi:MAG: pyridoxal phosphate-dependent aminotransferase [Anaerolineae bacterium]